MLQLLEVTSTLTRRVNAIKTPRFRIDAGSSGLNWQYTVLCLPFRVWKSMECKKSEIRNTECSWRWLFNVCGWWFLATYIGSSRSLRVILERPRAKELYREVYLANNIFTKNTSRYSWSAANAMLQPLEVTSTLTRRVTYPQNSTVQNICRKLRIKLAVHSFMFTVKVLKSMECKKSEIQNSNR